MNTEPDIYMTRDTHHVLSYEYTRGTIKAGTWMSTPIFDALAADRFASDVPTFNLGDYR